jgi:hypothetical protein
MVVFLAVVEIVSAGPWSGTSSLRGRCAVVTDAADIFGGYAEPVRSVLLGCSDGSLPQNVALMRLILAMRDAADLTGMLEQAAKEAGLHDVTAANRLRGVQDLARRHPGTWAIVRATAAVVPHGIREERAEAAVAQWAEGFDAAARISPEASVALYSLGDCRLLAATTDEIVAWMRNRSLLGRERAFLDVGCGIGRFETLLANEVGRVVGIDVSTEMVGIARQRCSGLSNVDIRLTSGLDLGIYRWEF